MEQKLFQITEFAKIARISRKTLQYYDELEPTIQPFNRFLPAVLLSTFPM